MRFEWRSVTPVPELSREQAAAYGVPSYAAQHIEQGETPDMLTMTSLEIDNPGRLRELLLGLPEEAVDESLELT